MSRKCVHIASLVLFGFVCLGFYGPARADQSVDEIETELLGLINQARENPLAMAGVLGRDPHQVLNDLPELAKILTQGLAPLTANGQLAAAAAEHTGDMLDKNYYSGDSPEGITPADRIRSAGYPASSCGETLGMLGFINFIEPGQAVWHIFENMFLDELNPERSEQRNILNPIFEDIGIACGAGVFSSDKNYFNVYVVTCDFAADGGTSLELELLELINQAREKPLEMAQSLGLDPNETLENLPELKDILMQGLPPLIFDSKLHQAAAAHSKDMIEKGYFSKQSQEGTLPEDRIANTGYEPEVTGEIIGSLVSPGYLAEKDAAFRIFAARFMEELDPERKTELNILNEAFKDGAVSFEVFQFNEEGDELGTYSLMVVDLGKTSVPAGPVLTGVVYRDLDGNGLYGLGEGIPHVPVRVHGMGSFFSVVTLPGGRFTLEIDPGVYTVLVEVNDAVWETVADLRTETAGLWFSVPARGTGD